MKEKETRLQRGWNGYVAIWERLTGWRSFLFFAAHYTVLFLVLSCFVFSAFWEEGTTFIWTADGMPSYFPKLIYISKTVREGIRSLLAGEGWTVPLYDFWSGTAKLPLEVEPVQWLAALCPWDQIDVMYGVLVLLRYYLVGLSFSVLGYYFKQKPLPIMIGTVSYVFCGYSIHAGVLHPQFLGPMVFLPLLVIGTERVLKRERPFLLIVMVFVSVISSLYRSCVLAIIVFLYALVRFFALYPKNRGREFLAMIGRLAVSGGTGIALGGAVVIPTLLQMLGTGRIGRDAGIYVDMVKYSLPYHEKFLSNFILAGSGAIGSWTCLGFSVLTLPAVLLLFIRRRREERSLRLLFILSTAMLLCPMVAYVLSGFNTVSNRWCFAYALCLCVILMFQAPHFEKMDRVMLCFLGIGVIFYILICYIAVESKYYRAPAIVLLFLSMLLIWICWYLHRQGRRPMLAVCLIITCMTVCYGASLEYAPEHGNGVSEFVKRGEPYEYYASSQYGSFSQSEAAKLEQPFYRVAGSTLTRPTLGAAFYYGIHGLSSHSSSQHSSFKQWLWELEFPWQGKVDQNYGVRDCAPMLTLAGVKYYVLREVEGKIEPYGFREIERVEGSDDAILENQYALPLGYTYDFYLPREAYDALSAPDKRNAQLQAVVLEGVPDSSDITEATIQPEARQIPVAIAVKKGLNWKNGKLKVTQEDATLTLEFAGLPQTETYLRVVNLDLTKGASTRKWSLSVATESTSNTASFMADGYVYSNGMKTQLIDLGYTEDGFTTCTLTFPEKGTFKLEDLEIWCQPMDSYGERIDALREEALENVETNWRGVTGTISVSRDKMLCVALPYDSGWSAYVDGERVKLYQANTAFMALELLPGDHTVELTYWTPGLTAGILLSCAGAAGVVILVVWQRKKRKREDLRDVAL